MAMRNDKTTQLISTDTQSTQCALTYLRLRLDRPVNAVGHLLEQNAGTATSLPQSS